MRYKIGDRLRVIEAPNISVLAEKIGKVGVVFQCGRTHLGRYQYELHFEGFDLDYYLEEELELVYRPSLEELLTSEYEEVRKYALACIFWKEHRGSVEHCSK